MKKLLIILPLVAVSVIGQAQTWNEWFRQKKTQIKYYVDQIAALQVYIESGQKGYGIYQDGLTAINDIKSGEFDLHNDYFESLSRVKAAIRRHPASEDIPELRKNILKTATELKEDAYLIRVRNALVKENNTLYEEYSSLIKDGSYALGDAERVKRIEKIYSEMVSQYLFLKDFVYENRVLDYQREHELNDIKYLRRAVTGNAATDP